MARWLDYERKTIKPKGERIDLFWVNAALTFFLIFDGVLMPRSIIERNLELYGPLILFFGLIISLISLRFGVHRTWSLILCGVYGLPLVLNLIDQVREFLGLI